MTTADIVAEMGQAIHVMLTFSESGLKKYMKGLKHEHYQRNEGAETIQGTAQLL